MGSLTEEAPDRGGDLETNDSSRDLGMMAALSLGLVNFSEDMAESAACVNWYNSSQCSGGGRENSQKKQAYDGQ